MGTIIYENGLFTKPHTLNPCAALVYDFFFRMVEQRFSFTSNIQTISIHDQYAGRETHLNNLAVDISITPIYLIPYFWVVLHKFTTFNVGLSMHNRHIHIDMDKNVRGGLNKKQLEIQIGENKYRFIEPHPYYIKNLPGSPPNDVIDNGRKIPFEVIQQYNKPIVDQYEIRPEYNSIMAVVAGEKGQCVFATFSFGRFEEQIAEDDKSPMPDYDIVRTINRVQQVIQKIPESLEYVLIGIGIALVILLVKK